MNEITMYRGNNRTITITVLNKTTGVAYNLTNCIVTMLVKKDIDDEDSDAIITKSTETPTEGAFVDPTQGTVEFYLVPADTTNAVLLKNNVVYPVDFEVETVDHKFYTVLRTSFIIMKR